MAVGDSNASESLVVLVHLFTRLDLFTKHCWRIPLIHPGFREVTISQQSRILPSVRF